ncbi:MAG: hypothetical protein ACRC6M_11805, partial [Microcystaceae cyanobacterium]
DDAIAHADQTSTKKNEANEQSTIAKASAAEAKAARSGNKKLEFSSNQLRWCYGKITPLFFVQFSLKKQKKAIAVSFPIFYQFSTRDQQWT